MKYLIQSMMACFFCFAADTGGGGGGAARGRKAEYEEMTKSELRDEIAKRKLEDPPASAHHHELVDVLVADDKKNKDQAEQTQGADKTTSEERVEQGKGPSESELKAKNAETGIVAGPPAGSRELQPQGGGSPGKTRIGGSPLSDAQKEQVALTTGGSTPPASFDDHPGGAIDSENLPDPKK